MLAITDSSLCCHSSHLHIGVCLERDYFCPVMLHRHGFISAVGVTLNDCQFVTATLFIHVREKRVYPLLNPLTLHPPSPSSCMFILHNSANMSFVHSLYLKVGTHPGPSLPTGRSCRLRGASPCGGGLILRWLPQLSRKCGAHM